jgi:hypothetical protein
MTAEQRYRRAVEKARAKAEREIQQFMAGKIDVLPCSGDYERRCIIAEIQRAMDGTSAKRTR